jgi:hypothetical protein
VTYENLGLPWFDEHNHPVDPDQAGLRDKRYHRRRCYKLASLIHVNRQPDFFFTSTGPGWDGCGAAATSQLT